MDEKNTIRECVGVTKGFCFVSVLAALFLGIVLGFLFSPIKHGLSDISIGTGNCITNHEGPTFPQRKRNRGGNG